VIDHAFKDILRQIEGLGAKSITIFQYRVEELVCEQDRAGELLRDQDRSPIFQDRSPIFQDRFGELGIFQDRVGEVIWRKIDHLTFRIASENLFGSKIDKCGARSITREQNRSMIKKQNR
jgi:hypothetical protein